MEKMKLYQMVLTVQLKDGENETCISNKVYKKIPNDNDIENYIKEVYSKNKRLSKFKITELDMDLNILILEVL